MGSLKYDFHTYDNKSFLLSFPKSPIIAHCHLQYKSTVGPLLAQHRQPEVWSASHRRVNVGPTVAKSTNHTTNSQCWPNVGPMLANLPTMQPPANIDLMAECYLGTRLTGGPPLTEFCQQMIWYGCYEYYPYMQKGQFIQ